MASTRRPRFTSITLENFRGVQRRQHFNLDGSVVLFWGPNGTGKTTVFDAILWLLQGNLPRISTHALRKNDEYVASAYAGGRPARVSVSLSFGGSTLEIERVGNSKSTSLAVREGVGRDFVDDAAVDLLHKALSGGELPLSELIATSGLLQQDDLRQLLRDKPDARYRQLLRLLGLESLEQFERFTETEYKYIRGVLVDAKAAHEKSRARVLDLREQIETVLSLSAASKTDPEELGFLFEAIDEAASVLEVHLDSTTAEALTELDAEATSALEVVSRVSELLHRIPLELPSAEESPERLEEAREVAAAALQEATARAASARSARDAIAAKHDDVMALVALAIPMLEEHGHEGNVPCPVCGTSVPIARTVHRLSDLSSSGSELAAAERRLEEQEDVRTAAHAALGLATAAVEDHNRRRRALWQATKDASTVEADIRLLQSLRTIRIRSLELSPLVEPGVMNATAEQRARVRTLLDGVTEALTVLVTAATSARHRATARADSINRSGQLPRLEALKAVADREADTLLGAYETARRAETAAAALRHGTTAATESIFRARFEAIEPLMNDIYGRLDPHPTFTKLDFAIERYRSRGTAMASVRDESADLDANPLLVFSSAQTNAVVLSAFLALGWAATGGGLPFALMDDPLQSLDDVNVLGFADLVGQLRKDKQVMLSTHEERFARLLERKLTMSDSTGTTIIHRFLGWTREGPRVDTRVLLGDDVLSASAAS